MFIPQMQCGTEPPYYEVIKGVGKVESTAHWSWYMCELKNQANAPKTTANPYQQRTSDLSGITFPDPPQLSWWEKIPHDMQLLLVGGTIALVITVIVLIAQSRRNHNA